MTNQNQLSIHTNYELDQLKEVVNMGASHASTALSQIIKLPVHITVPEVSLDKAENIAKFIGDSKEVVTAVLVKVLEDTQGMITFIFPRGNDKKLARLMCQGQSSDSDMLDELDRSALKEVGNILAGASLSAFSKFLNINILHSVSEVVTDMLGSIINTIIAEISHKSNILLTFKVDFEVENTDVKTSLFFFMDPEASTSILESIEKKVD
jgi:chemotaxis protein CheC